MRTLPELGFFFDVKRDPMITGLQVREARRLLRMSTYALAERARVRLATVHRAEATDEMLPLSVDQTGRLQGVLEAAGVEFLSHGQPGVRLRKAGQ